MESDYNGPVKFEFSSADEVFPVFVSVFDNMRKIYDNYAANGIKSLDGNGLPLMIGLGFQEYGKEVEVEFKLPTAIPKRSGATM